MYNYGFTGFLFLLSLLLSIKGLWGLLTLRKYGLIIVHLGFLIGFPFILVKYMEFLQRFDEEARFWLFLPITLLIPVWLMWGFFVNKNAENIEIRRGNKDLN